MPRPQSIRSLQMPSRHQDAGGHVFPSVPPSPSLSTTTRASLLDFPSRPAILVTRADLRASLAAYEALLASAKAYTSAMLSMSKASSDLACALETCARVKGAHDSGPGLQAASGLHFLKSNYEQVLCDTFWKDFSIPLLSHYDTYRSACTDRQVLHDKAVAQKSKELKEAEARNNRAGRKKERDLNSFRRALAELQSHVDAIDELKAQYYNEVLDAEQEVWSFIESKVALVVRSQIDVSERISSKGLNDPVLEQMLATIPDPFGSYGPPKQDGEIFSILPPISLISSGANSVHNTSTEAATNDTSATDVDTTSEDVKPASGGPANGAYKTKSVLPANIMSPSTPSKGLTRAGLTRNGSASATPTRASQSAADDLPASSTPRGEQATNAASGSTATPKAQAAKGGPSLNGPTHLARDSLLGLSAVSEATTSVSTSDGSPHTASGGLFGSESMDFEELLSQPPKATVGPNTDASQADDQFDPQSDAQSAEASSVTATAAGRLRQVLSIIEEDTNGPLSKAAQMGTASRPVSSVYDAGPDPFADRDEAVAGSNDDKPLRDIANEGNSRHRRTSSKLSID
ncbi:hypothetical protein PSEUBRA_003600 [Kalmanozyma brasiliensis GHG001]|uniref:IMD domain-containing protein n=1 Tax=Kalmanozyma brasiliensis (strain GHG001) TaxID=1365824 RepID=V5E9D9_KALBG|nr:uncharacterized protein PSEUBRA_003600 [Kalmanozyma brasiliensis GHG001]EST06971.1 hypothetical protein PSEUBRA_003600 [Kalmanozyma brasiliensis GHG001]